ncbi:MAG: ubiquinol-cytochrome c reductase iron-sulfur subunit [Planctomycetota bacterium]
MAGGLAAGYGTAGLIAARYLFPAKPDMLEWVYLATLERLAPGESLVFRSPAGEKVTLARRTPGENAEDFIALSSTCPHLGCQVHWEGQNNRFFCPCHNGVFEPSGKATGGPPADAGQSLPRYELKVEGRLLYIRVPTQSLVGEGGRRVASLQPESRSAPPGPGHDPCLHERPASTA